MGNEQDRSAELLEQTILAEEVVHNVPLGGCVESRQNIIKDDQAPSGVYSTRESLEVATVSPRARRMTYRPQSVCVH